MNKRAKLCEQDAGYSYFLLLQLSQANWPRRRRAAAAAQVSARFCASRSLSRESAGVRAWLLTLPANQLLAAPVAWLAGWLSVWPIGLPLSLRKESEAEADDARWLACKRQETNTTATL